MSRLRRGGAENEESANTIIDEENDANNGEAPDIIQVESIELDIESLSLKAGETAKLQASVSPDHAADLTVTWESSDTSVCTVEDGMVNAIAAGDCIITAFAGDKSVSCEVTVTEDESASLEVAVTEDEAQLLADENTEDTIPVEEGEIARGAYGQITWVIDSSGKLTVEGSGDFSDASGYNRAPWFDNREKITSAEINVTGMTDASYMFFVCDKLSSINLSGFKTNQVTDMSGMFSGCETLSSIDLGSFDTSMVTDMGNMFEGCKTLSSIDLRSFDTSMVTNMFSMFSGCETLSNIDVSGFDTSLVTYMSYMFYNCETLDSIDVSGFDTSLVWGMDSMFEGCKALSSIDLSGFYINGYSDVSSSVGGMLSGCDNLSTIYTPLNLNMSVSLPGGTWYQPDGEEITELPQRLDYSMVITKGSKTSVIDESYITAYKSRTVYECGDTLNIDDLRVRYYSTDGTIITVTEYSTNASQIDMTTEGTKTLVITYNDLTYEIELTVYIATAEIESGVIDADYGHITWSISSGGKLTVTGTGDYSDPSSYDRAPWDNYKNYIKSARIEVKNMTNASRMFSGYQNLSSIDLSGFDTSQVKDMSSMFSGCKALNSIDLSGLDTSQVTDMSDMFADCNALRSIDLSGLDTSQVTDMNAMFYGCQSLASIDFSGLDTSQVKDMGSMFTLCEKLSSIDMSSFDTSQVTKNINDQMFARCYNLSTIYTPLNLNLSVSLSEGIWYKPDGTEITELPKGLDYSIMIARGRIPVIEKSYITAYKSKIVYECGDTLNIDDLRVKYYSTDGTVTIVKEYSTNASEIDMFTAGTKILVITYEDLTYEIELTVTKMEQGDPYITATKTKTVYDCGDELDLEDLIVKYVDQEGNVTVLTRSEYSTNASEINMSAGGTKTLLITYKDLTYEIELTVLERIDEGVIDTDHGHITWVISGSGKLTVTGTGDYSDSSSYDRAPWYDHRVDIKSAEIKVQNMTDASYMFWDCINLGSVDFSSFDTGQVTNMYGMFNGCETLSSIDLSGFDTSRVRSMTRMFNGCNNLSTIYTPLNLNLSVTLPNGTWYQPDGTQIAELPKGLDYSILIAKGRIPGIEKSYITAYKSKIVYECGDTLNIDDLRVVYYSTDGTITIVKEYSTNASEIDMSTEGTKILIITYNDLTCEIELTVTKKNGSGDSQDDDLPPDDDIIPDGIWSVGITDTVYTGSSITQSFRLYDGNKRLQEKVDYTVSYKNNKAAYTYTEKDYADFESNLQNTGNAVKFGSFDPKKAPQVIIKMKGNYSGSQTIYFRIQPADITGAGFTANDLAVTYSGKKQTPTPTVTWNGKALKYNTDFYVPEYDNVKNDKTAFSESGLYGLTITGKNNFTGEISIKYLISDGKNQIAMSSVTIKGIGSQVWTGQQIQPEGYTVKYKTDVLSEANGDYTVSIGENTAVGTGTITLIGTGADNDGDGYSYIGTKTVSFKITGTAMSKVTVSEVNKSYTYSGEAIEPRAVLTYEDAKTAESVTLKEGTHYTVSYQKNQDAGTATIIFTGLERGGYTGTKKTTFKIAASGIGDGEDQAGQIRITYKNTENVRNGIYIAPYMKGGAKPEVIVTIGSKMLESGKDYTVSYTNNKKIALSTDQKAPTLTVKGKGNYSGSKKVTFSIAIKPLSEENGITVTAKDKVVSTKMNGYRQSFKVYDADGKALGSSDYDAKNAVYTLIQTKNEDGTMNDVDEVLNKNSIVPADSVIRITVQGKGNYDGGSVSGTYRILQANHDISKATIQINNQEYTGQPIMITDQSQFKPNKVYIKIGKETTVLTLGEDIEVVPDSYVKNINKGTAKVTFRGINDFGGTKTVSYKIGTRSITDFWKGIFGTITGLMAYNEIQPEIPNEFSLKIEKLDVHFCTSFSLGNRLHE